MTDHDNRDIKCEMCNGTGKVLHSCWGSDNMDVDEWEEPCDDCGGSGNAEDDIDGMGVAIANDNRDAAMSYERLVAAARKARHFIRTHGGYKFVRAEFPFEMKLMDDEDFVPVLGALDAALPPDAEGGAS